MKDDLKILSHRLLLVEGNDEYWFFIQLLRFLGLNKNTESFDVQVIDIEGRTKFASSLSLLVKRPDFLQVHAVGFVRDAEENPANSSYKSMVSAIQKHLPSFPIPKIGSITKSGNVACGIFIMPNNADAGMLEDMCLKSVAAQPLCRHVDSYVSSAFTLLSDVDKKKYNTHKARVQTYLAGQVEIVNSLANAAKKHIWDFSSPVFSGISDYVRTLANI